jgi:hypothetical protein
VKFHPIRWPAVVRPTIVASIGLACAALAMPSAAQNVGTGGGGRAVRIVRDSAAPRTVAMVYEGLFSFVRIERAEPGAAPSLHPVSVSVPALQKALGSVKFGNEPLFNDEELAEIAPPLVTALGRVTPDQDISFAVSGKHSALGPLAPRSVTTGRLFRNADGLQFIVGLARKPFESEFNATGTLIAFEPGRRAKPVDASLRLADADPTNVMRRGDWASLVVATAAASVVPATAPATEAAALPARSPAAAGATTAPAPSSAAPAAAVPRPAPDADALYRNVSERLKALQRLRDAGLITPQEYDEKRRQILSEL